MEVSWLVIRKLIILICLCVEHKPIGCLSMCLLRLLSSTSLRPLFLLSMSLLGLMLLERWKPKLPIITGKPLYYLKLVVRLCHSLPKPMHTVTETIQIYTSSTQYFHWMEEACYDCRECVYVLKMYFKVIIQVFLFSCSVIAMARLIILRQNISQKDCKTTKNQYSVITCIQVL